MLLSRLVEVSSAVATTGSRLAKRDLIAALLHEVAQSSPDAEEIDIAASYLSGTLRQRRTGLGWRSVAHVPPPAHEASVSLAEVDAALEHVGGLSGPGSTGARRRAVLELFARLTAAEQDYLRDLLTGNVRQGALDAVMLEAVAAASGLPVAVVRRSAMFSAPTGPIAAAALTGGAAALERFTLVAGRPVRPMLASTAPDVQAAVEKVGGPFAVDAKLDGIRIQVHKHHDEVTVFTRSLEEISSRLPEVVHLTRSLAADDLVLDGEALALDEQGRPRPFQETAATTAARAGGGADITPFFFDLLLHDGEAMIESPLRSRLARLDALVPEGHRVRRRVTDSAEESWEFFETAVAAGQEGVVLKRLDAPYDAGRRGSAWVKVKPRHTLDLVVLAAEWGSGRRRGWLSNIHLGARGPDGPVMLGKTFKGMTDEMLQWQTERFLALESSRDGHVVHLRPEQVVEVAFDGVQRSPHYPGGVALRFARVLRYRDDKPVTEIDSLQTVRDLGGLGSG